MKSRWWEEKEEKLQSHADTNNMKRFYFGLKEVWGPRVSTTSQLKSGDGFVTLTDDKMILEHWAEHINTLLNDAGAVSLGMITEMPQKPKGD